MRVAGKIIIAGLSVLIALYLLKVALSVGLVAVSSLSKSNTLTMPWTIIVPNGYVGNLAIRFRCPGGHPLVRNGQLITIFSAAGTDCVRDDFPGWEGQETVRRANGTAIPDLTFVSSVPKRGDALVDLGTAGGQVGNGVDASFMVYYVGPVACAARVLRFEQPLPRCRYEDDIVFARRAFHLPPAPTSRAIATSLP